MDFKSAFKSGREAFLQGKGYLDIPANYKSSGYIRREWRRGWSYEDEKIYKGNTVAVGHIVDENLGWQPACQGEKCTAMGGVGHSSECKAEHDAILTNRRLRDERNKKTLCTERY